MGKSPEVSRIHSQNTTVLRNASYNVELETLYQEVKPPEGEVDQTSFSSKIKLSAAKQSFLCTP
jgi:hypothetical protein